jgi:hypothetical protein
MRKVGLLWTCIHSFCLLRPSSAYEARKDPRNLTLLATRKLCTAKRRVQSDLVLKLQPESQRKLVPRNTVTFARSMGVDTRRTILVIAVSLRKTEQKKSDFCTAKKGGKKPNPTNQSFAQLSKKLDKLEKVIEKKDTKKRKRRSSDSDSDSE